MINLKVFRLVDFGIARTFYQGLEVNDSHGEKHFGECTPEQLKEKELLTNVRISMHGESHYIIWRNDKRCEILITGLPMPTFFMGR